jgi:hypothetical protein
MGNKLYVGGLPYSVTEFGSHHSGARVYRVSMRLK